MTTVAIHGRLRLKLLIFSLWCVIACSTGMVLVYLTSPPFWGSVMLGGDQYQYGGETILVFALSGGMSLCLILLASPLSHPGVRIVTMLVFVALLRGYIHLFMAKASPWYNMHLKNTHLIWMTFPYVPWPS